MPPGQLMKPSSWVQITSSTLLGAGMATYTMAWDVGAVLGGMLLGLLVELTSYSLGFLICGFVPLIGFAFFVAKLRPPQPAETAGQANVSP